MQILSLEVTKKCSEADREILAGLAKAGFKTNDGEGGGGFLMSVRVLSLSLLHFTGQLCASQYFKRGGGYCMHTGFI
jgi:hypothetical protein